MPSVLIEDLSIDNYEDTEIMYGYTYKYTISVVYAVKFYKLLGTDGQVQNSMYVMSSRRSPFITVTAVERVAPPAPLGLGFHYTNEGLLISWHNAPNPQEDIKRYQIFRRKSIEEPFILIGELDFDDSIIKTKRGEYIPDFLRMRVDHKPSWFTDESWDTSSEFIYAVCSIDAHDLSSGYSEQIKVSYDRAEALIKTSLISGYNSPKQYPNFNIPGNIFTDSIKDSGHKKLKIYFDPEYLKVTGIVDEDSRVEKNLEHLPLLDYSHTRDETYQIQLINLDRQKSQTIKIKVSTDLEAFGKDTVKELKDSL